jgi:hypothetical protein
VQALFEQFKLGDATIEEYPEAYEQVQNHLSEFRRSEMRPGYFSNDSKARSSDLVDTIAKPFRLGYKTLRYFIRYHFDVGDSNYIINDHRKDPVSRHLIDAVVRRIRQLRVGYRDHFEEPRLDESFVFFPLHLQPEASTRIRGQMYIDQAGLVRQLSRSLPATYKLYIKDHPNMVDRRVSYYDQFDELPNVRVIHPQHSSHKLIKHANLVTTITGTAGFEALRYKKPAMTFGHTSYNAMSMVYQGGDPDTLSEDIHHALTEYKHDERELEQYLTALYEEGFRLPGGAFSATPENAREKARILHPQIEEVLF